MKKMKWILTALLVCVCCVLALSQESKAQEHRTIGQVFNRSLTDLEKEFVPAADAMPEDKYSFAPSNGEFKGVRSFAQQVKHVATANYEFAAVILGEKVPIEVNDEKGPDTVKSKAEIMKYLSDSFVYLHKALNTIDEKNLVQPFKNPWSEGTATRLGFATMALAHPNDHYGQMVVYLRMNGIVPPASR